MRLICEFSKEFFSQNLINLNSCLSYVLGKINLIKIFNFCPTKNKFTLNLKKSSEIDVCFGN